MFIVLFLCVCVYVCTFIYLCIYKCCLKRSNQSLGILFLILFNVLLVIKIILIKQSHSSIQFCTLFTDNIRKSWFKYLFCLLFLPFFYFFFLISFSFFFFFGSFSDHRLQSESISNIPSTEKVNDEREISSSTSRLLSSTLALIYSLLYCVLTCYLV